MSSKDEIASDERIYDDIHGLVAATAVESVWPRNARHSHPSELVKDYINSYQPEERYSVALGVVGVCLRIIGFLTSALLQKHGVKRMDKRSKADVGGFLRALDDRHQMNTADINKDENE